MEYGELDKALQEAILALLDVKPNDPIRFLATHFQMQCEKNWVSKAVYLLQDMTIYHPAYEQRISKAYIILSKCNKGKGLTGKIYNDFLLEFIADMPALKKGIFLQYLERPSTEFVSSDVFSKGVNLLTFLNQFVSEVKVLFADICIENPKEAPVFLCELALSMMGKCLIKPPKISVDGSCSLRIADLGSHISKLFVKDFPTPDGVDLHTFLCDAVDVFVSEGCKEEI